MRLPSRLGARLRNLFHRDGLEKGMDDELRFHLEMETEKNLGRGIPPDEARRLAFVSLGGLEGIKEECRESWGVRLLENVLQDVRYGLRSLRTARGFTAAVVLTLALGIGANTAIFSVVNAVLLRPLPYGGQGEVVALHSRAPGIGITDTAFSPLEVGDFREQARTLDALAEYHSMSFTLLGGAEPQRVRTGVVSWNFFDVLQVSPILGRSFRPADEERGADAVLLLTHEFWRNQLGGDMRVVGRTFQMNDRVHTVIGVLPPLPSYPGAVDVFMPTSACPFRSRPDVAQKRDARMVSAFARVRKDVSLEQARADLMTVANRLAAQYPEEYPKQARYRVDLVPAREEMVGSARPTFLVLLATVLLVLLIACFNVASLIIARLLAREKELALRAALGASRRRLVGQLLVEAVLLALLGGALGLVFAWGSLGLLSAFAARFTPRAREIRLDGTVLVFTLLVSVATGLLAGALPGLPKWRHLAQALQQGARATFGRTRLRGALVVAELALSFVLLIGAALTLRSFSKLLDVNPGFRAENVLTAHLELNFSRYLTPEHRPDARRIVDGFHANLDERLKTLPGVVSVGAGWIVPLDTGFDNTSAFRIEGVSAEGAPPPHAQVYAASPDYFNAIGVPLLRGRPFEAHDRSKEAGVVVVSESLVRGHWGSADPLGERVSLDDGKTWRTVVGVVGDVRYTGLDAAPVDVLYVPLFEFPGVSVSYFVRTLGNPTVIAGQLRSAVRAVDPETPVTNVRTLEEVRSESLASSRLTASLLGLFALIALAIAATGLSGLMAFSVSQRTQEIGIRMALGADSRTVLGLVLWQGLRSVGLGLVVGVLGALAASRLVAGLLFGVSPTDAGCYVGCGVVLVAIGTLACLPPARRATGVHPQLALRGH
jgi:putative ABC transport system permease protein